MSDISSKLKSARFEAVTRMRSRCNGTILCVMGRDLRFDSQLVCLQCYRELQPLIEDLARVAGVVAYADRMISRCTSDVWARELEIVIPVSEPDRWGSSEVLRSLTNALDLVTGDCWNIHFKKLPVTADSGFQTHFLVDEAKPPVVIPFSDGLDSYAVLKLEHDVDPSVEFVPVTVGRQWRRWVMGPGRLYFPFSITDRNRCDHHRFRESSYRSRAFAYTVMAGAVAYLRNANRVIIPESGQGILGPSLQPVANEAPDIRTHPKFTRAVSNFLTQLLGSGIEFVHPRLFHTKAETLTSANVGTDDVWKQTRSCPRDQRHISFDGHCYQCGVCSACLLRRMSVWAGSLLEETPYYWHNLSASDLAHAALPGTPPHTANDERIARAGVLSHYQLSEVMNSRRADLRIAEASEELAELLNLPIMEVEAKLLRLLQQHRNEWTGFVSHYGTDSILTKWRSQLP